MDKQKAMIEATGVSFAYSDATVLEDVSFQVESGEFVGIIGSNGAGKSTLLRLVLGELSPRSGSLLLFGKPAVNFDAWGKVGYVPQNGAVQTGRFPATALEIVTANLYSQIGPLRLPGKRHRDKAREALAAVDISELETRMIDRMSGGQLQRVLIARALVAEPELLLLDEPTAGVDARAADHLYQLLGELNRQGITILMVTHDMERSARYVHRALCVEDSTMVALDSEQMAHELSHKHRHPPREGGPGEGE